MSYKNRVQKKWFLNTSNIKKINTNSNLKYNVLFYFMQKEKLGLSKKIIKYFLVTESGSSFSLKNWFIRITYKLY